jgi:hypothetical protein
MYNVSENAVPMQYPLAMSGLYGPDASGYAPPSVLNKTPSAVPGDANLGPVYGPAYTPPKPAGWDPLNPTNVPWKQPLPHDSMIRWKYGLKEEFFKGVPNYYVYGGALVLFLSGWIFKKRS